MTRYAKMQAGVVVNATFFEGDMPEGWNEPDDVWVASEGAQIGWTYADGIFAVPQPLPPLPPDLKAVAADKRWRIETGGIVVAGATIATSRDNQAMITGAVAYAQLNPQGSIDFKTSTGWVTLTAAQMIGIGEAVGAHVQACFAAEKAIDADISAALITTAEQIESDARWPS